MKTEALEGNFPPSTAEPKNQVKWNLSGEAMSLVIAVNGNITPFHSPESSKLKKSSASSESHFVKDFDNLPVKEKVPKKHKKNPTVNNLLNEYAKNNEKNLPRIVKKAFQVMVSPVITLTPNKSVLEAVSLMEERDIRHIPVLVNNQVVGMISNEDLLRNFSTKAQGSQSIAEIMTKRVVLAYDSTAIDFLARTLVEHKIGAIPIINRRHELVGIVSQIDLLKLVMKSFPLEVWT